MRIVLFGATGPTGQQVVEDALQRGHSVLAIVRNPDKLTTKHDNLKVVETDIMNTEAVTSHMKGYDAVLSCLGSPLSLFWTVTLYTDSMKAIVKSMRDCKITRLVCITSWCTVYKPENPKFIEYFLKPFILRQVLSNMAQMESYLSEECTDIDYTVVRPPGLKNTESSNKPPTTCEGLFVPDCRGGISRRDVAKFMLECTESGSWKRKMVAIG